MPFLFLSPSTQDFNPYVTTGNEQLWMNRLADRMTPYLHASGINVTRNDPNANAATSIRLSNEGNYDFHLALHSNASSEENRGKNRGIEVYYYPTSDDGLRMANILVDHLKEIYPLPEQVRAISTTVLGEVRRTKAPSVLVEFGYHDNVDDANWLTENLETVAQATAQSVTEYFGVPFLPVIEPRQAAARQTVNLRSLPSVDSPILAQIPENGTFFVLGQFDEWYSARTDTVYGYVLSRDVELT